MQGCVHLLPACGGRGRRLGAAISTLCRVLLTCIDTYTYKWSCSYTYTCIVCTYTYITMNDIISSLYITLHDLTSQRNTYTSIPSYIHTYIYTYTNSYIHAYMHTCTHTCIHTHTCINPYMFIKLACHSFVKFPEHCCILNGETKPRPF